MSAPNARPQMMHRQIADRGAIVIVLGVILAIGMIASPAFSDPAYLLNTVRQIAPVGIAALGVTFVMIMGGVDLSVGAVISMTVILCPALMQGSADNLYWAVLVSCAAGAAIGLMNGIILACSRISSFILTLGMGVALVGLIQMASGGTAQGAVAPGFREFFNHRIGGMLPVLALTFLMLAGLAYTVQKSTIFGRQIFLIGSNRRAAVLSGVPVRGVIIAAYGVSGLFAALGGLALLARSGVSSTSAGQGLEFQVLAAIVLGGTTFEGGRGGIPGTVAGVLVLAFSFNLVNILGLPYQAQLVVMGVIIILSSALYGQFRGRV